MEKNNWGVVTINYAKIQVVLTEKKEDPRTDLRHSSMEHKAFSCTPIILEFTCLNYLLLILIMLINKMVCFLSVKQD